MVDTPNLLNRWARSWVFKNNLAGTFAGAEDRPEISVLAWDVTCQQVDIPPSRNGFRGFGLQVLFQLLRIVRVGLGNVFNWHLSVIPFSRGRTFRIVNCRLNCDL